MAFSKIFINSGSCNVIFKQVECTDVKLLKLKTIKNRKKVFLHFDM